MKASCRGGDGECGRGVALLVKWNKYIDGKIM